MTDITSWSTTPGNDARMNRCTNIANTGTYLASLDKTKHGIVICTSDGGGLVKDHVYLCDAAGEAFIDMTSIAPHLHTVTEEGGSIEKIFNANTTFCDLWLTKTHELDKANWNQVVSGTGTIENKTDGTTEERSIRLRPNATSGSGATIYYPHFQVNFANESYYVVKLQIETATSIALHTGVHADTVTSADSNNRKYQAEVCTVTNNNWWLRTANGSANSASDTGIAITTGKTSIKMRHEPDEPRTTLSINLVEFEKTSNIATDSTSSRSNVIKHSVKNSTAADRPLLIYGTRLGYYIDDNWE